MSRTWMVGRPGIFSQRAPPSLLTYAPNSVPAKSSFASTWSSATPYTVPRFGRSPAIDTHVRPASVLFSRYGAKSPFWWLFTAANTVLASCRDVINRWMYALAGTPGIESFLRHVAPPSSDTCTRPSSVPT